MFNFEKEGNIIQRHPYTCTLNIILNPLFFSKQELNIDSMLPKQTRLSTVYKQNPLKESTSCEYFIRNSFLIHSNYKIITNEYVRAYIMS